MFQVAVKGCKAIVYFGLVWRIDITVIKFLLFLAYELKWDDTGAPLGPGGMTLTMLAQVTYVDVEHQGTYWCHVFNDQEDEDSQKIEVFIGKESACLI